jgi:hypothetical protein
VRWLIIRIFKGIAVDRFLRHSGISSMIDQAGRLQTSQVVAKTAYWLILVAGILVALNSFNSDLSSRVTETIVFLLPKLLAAAAIIIVGAWIGRYRRTIWFGPSTRACQAAHSYVCPGPFTFGVAAAATTGFRQKCFPSALSWLRDGAAGVSLRPQRGRETAPLPEREKGNRRERRRQPRRHLHASALLP